MKTKVLKLEGSEKIKFNIDVEFNEAKVKLYYGGKETKFHEIIKFNPGNKLKGDYLEEVGLVCERLYKLYLYGMEFEEAILKSFEDKYHIEIEL